jgi:cytoskeleton-associated protein 5
VTDPQVRDNSAEAIGTAWKVVGEKVISPFLTEVDNLKLGKVRSQSSMTKLVRYLKKNYDRA